MPDHDRATRHAARARAVRERPLREVHHVADLDARIKDTTKGPGHTYGKPFSEWLLLDHERDMLKAELAWMDKYLEIGKTKPSKA